MALQSADAEEKIFSWGKFYCKQWHGAGAVVKGAETDKVPSLLYMQCHMTFTFGMKQEASADTHEQKLKQVNHSNLR